MTTILMVAPGPTSGTVLFSDGSPGYIQGNGFLQVPEQDLDIFIGRGYRIYHTPGEAYTTYSNASNGSLLAAKIAGAGTVICAVSGGATLSHQLDTAANILASMPGLVISESYKLRIINNNSGVLTLTTNTGLTLTGTMTITNGTWREFLVTYTAAGTITLQEIGTGTDS